MVELIPVTAAAQVEQVSQLAMHIWNEHYPRIIGRAQVDYMLETLQSPRAIQAQIDADYRYYLIDHDGVLAGYAALLLEPEQHALFLGKIYVDSGLRGNGIGRDVVQQVIAMARQRQLDLIWLTVNKNNTGAIAAYEGMGFRNVQSVVMDVGEGFVMDDYRMELQLGKV